MPLNEIQRKLSQLCAALEQIQGDELDMDSRLRLNESRSLSREVSNILIPQLTPPRHAVGDRAIKLLVIDGDPLSQRMLKFALERRQFDVRSIENPEEAESAILEFTPDVVMLDIYLPRRSGFELLTEINQLSQQQSFRIVVTSARDFDHHRLAALESGADDFISKPFSMAELAAKLRHLVD